MDSEGHLGRSQSPPQEGQAQSKDTDQEKEGEKVNRESGITPQWGQRETQRWGATETGEEKRQNW